MLLPKPRRLGMALHCREDRDNLTRDERGLSFMLSPPFVERAIGADIKALFRGWCFRESIADVRAIYDQIFCGANGVKEARTGLVDAVGVDFIQDLHRARPAGSITDTTSLFASVERLDVVRPHEVEYGVVLFHSRRDTEAFLIIILVEL
jgi:hypothetical protein